MTWKRRFFVADSNQYAPDGFLVLGTILTNFTDPESALNHEDVVSLSKPIKPTSEYNSYQSLDSSYSVRFGIFAAWMDKVGLRLGYKKDGRQGESYHFDKLEKYVFAPDKAYVARALRQPQVEAYIKENEYRANLYMVTGLQIARGARRHSTRGSEVGGEARLGADGGAIGLPGLSVGPQVEGSSSRTEVAGFGSSDDFVYAWRVKEIKYRQETWAMKDVTGKVYGKQTDEAVEEARLEESRRVANESDFSTSGLSPREVNVSRLKLESDEVVDKDEDGEDVECEILWVG